MNIKQLWENKKEQTVKTGNSYEQTKQTMEKLDFFNKDKNLCFVNTKQLKMGVVCGIYFGRFGLKKADKDDFVNFYIIIDDEKEKYISIKGVPSMYAMDFFKSVNLKNLKTSGKFETRLENNFVKRGQVLSGLTNDKNYLTKGIEKLKSFVENKKDVEKSKWVDEIGITFGYKNNVRIKQEYFNKDFITALQKVQKEITK